MRCELKSVLGAIWRNVVLIEMHFLVIASLVLAITLLAPAQSAVTYTSMVLSKGDVTFKLKPEDRAGLAAQSYQSDLCNCDRASALASINKRLKADVSGPGMQVPGRHRHRTPDCLLHLGSLPDYTRIAPRRHRT